MALLEFKNLTKIYKKGFLAKKIRAINNLSFSVQENGITGFIGHNGAGKTSSIKILLGLVKPTSGSSFINGIASPLPKARKKVAFTSEQPYFYTHLSVVEQLAFVYKLNSLKIEKQQSEIERVLNVVDLFEVRNKNIHTLSKGMLQRLNMAQALLGDPDIFIFDEPMSGLDPLGRRLFRNIFIDLAGKNKCIFFSTHILEDIQSVCQNVVVLEKGSLIFQGKIKDLISENMTGTEIVVKKMANNHCNFMSSMGFEVSSLDERNQMIFIPREGNPTSCHNYLYEHKIYPLSIKPRACQLEEIFFNRPHKGKPNANTSLDCI